jgi:hypothetical protein
VSILSILLVIYLVSALFSGKVTGLDYKLTFEKEKYFDHGTGIYRWKNVGGVTGVTQTLKFSDRFWLSFIPVVNTISACYWTGQYLSDRDFNVEARKVLKEQGEPHLQSLRAYKNEQRENRIKELERLTDGSH